MTQPNPLKIKILDPLPTQPNPWVNPTHGQLCNILAITGAVSQAHFGHKLGGHWADAVLPVYQFILLTTVFLFFVNSQI